MNLTEMQDKRGRLVTQAREALDEIKGNTDESRAAELDERHDKIMAEFDQLEGLIAREEQVAKLEARADELEQRAREEKRPGAAASAEGADNGSGVTYREAFSAYLAAGGVTGEMNPEHRDVLKRGYSQFGGETRAQTTTNAAGGFTIPQELMPDLVKSMLDWGPMYDPGITREINTSSGEVITIPTVDDTTGGPNVTHSEGVTLTDDGGVDVTFAEKQLEAYAWNTEFLRVSKELADDSVFGMESVLVDLLGERLGRTANAQLTTGTGSSAPHGIATASSAGTAAAANNAIVPDELITFEHEVDPAYRRGSRVRWMFHDSTLAAIRKMKDGQNNYLWQMGDIRTGAPGTLLGHQYEINQDMAELTSGVNSRVVLFGDFNKYIVRKVGNPLVAAVQDKDFWPGFGVAGYIRFDGELTDTAAVKHLPLAAV